MRMKKSFLGLILILSLLAAGCSKQVLLDENDIKLLNYNFKITDLENIDKTLSKQIYSA